MTTLKSPEADSFAPDILSSNEEGTLLDRNTYLEFLQGTTGTPERGRALSEATRHAVSTMDHDPQSYERAQVASATRESSVDILPLYETLSSKALTVRLRAILRKDKINGTHTKFTA